jgi:hypothetical protein
MSDGKDEHTAPFPLGMGATKSHLAAGHKKTWQCPHGHRYSDEEGIPWSMWVTNDPEHDSGPICPYCMVDWARKAFPTMEVPELTEGH